MEDEPHVFILPLSVMQVAVAAEQMDTDAFVS